MRYCASFYAMALGVSQLAAAGPSSEKEVALGRAMERELEKQEKVVETPAEVLKLADRLRSAAKIEQPLKVKTLDSEDSMANFLPGRIIYVSTGFLRHATEHQVEAVLAHEVAHIATRHGLNRAPSNSGSIPLVFMGSWVGSCLRSNKSPPVPISFETRMRQNEIEADALAAKYMDEIGYSGDNIAAAFEAIKAHPTPARRQQPTLKRSEP